MFVLVLKLLDVLSEMRNFAKENIYNLLIGKKVKHGRDKHSQISL